MVMVWVYCCFGRSGGVVCSVYIVVMVCCVG